MTTWSAGLLPAPLNADPGMKLLEQAVNVRPSYDPFTGELGITDPTYPIGHVLRYGADPTGTKDSTAAFQACSDACYGSTALPHASTNARLNVPFQIPGGTFIVNNWLLTRVVGARIIGAGRFATTLKSTTVNTPVLTTNGLGYSHFEGIHFLNSAANTGPIIELSWDGTTPSYSGGLQSNTFTDCYFSGGTLAAYGVRVGNGGFMGSEHLFLNCFWDSCTAAGFYSANFNALQNTFIGGNMQNCTKYGIQVQAGSVNVYSMGFQNQGVNGEQITNAGYDIKIAGSANDTSTIRGCRSESYSFLDAGSSFHIVIAEGNNVVPGPNLWTALTAIPLNTLVFGTSTGGDGKLYRVTTAGTTGAVEPVWPGTGTIANGSVVFTYVGYNVVTGGPGLILRHCILPLGRVFFNLSGQKIPTDVTGCIFSRTDWLFETAYNQTGAFLTLVANVVLKGGLGPNNAGALQAYTSQPASGPQVPYSANYQMNLGIMPLLFSKAVAGGVMGGDVGFVRGTSDHVTAALNTLSLIGTLAAVVPTTADTAGTDTIISGGQGTGTGASGKLRLRAAPAGGAGSTANTPADVAFVDEAGFTLTTAGTGFKVKEGTNATMGRATLVAGTVTVSTTKVTAGSEVFLQAQTTGGTAGELTISARTAATSFTILSSNAADTRVIAWLIVEPS